jgi:hypothetical protein
MAMVVAVAAMMTFLLIGTAAGKYNGGTGEPNDPYRIVTPQDLNDIGNYEEDWDKNFILINDVNLAQYTGTQFKIIGRFDYPNNKPFTGVFDGNDHKIWNFTWNSTDGNCIGLFGFVDEYAQIKNLGLENVDVNVINGMYVGGLVGGSVGEITHCYSTGSVSANECIGGLVGDNEGTITNCYSTASVSGTWPVGGLVGVNYYMITNCRSTSSVWGQWCIGGLVGGNWETISSCYSTGNVSGTWAIGGLAGSNGTSFARISSCYSSGIVSGDERVGGLVGSNAEGRIANCYSSASTSGNNYVGGLVGFNGGGEFTSFINNCYSTGGVLGDIAVGGLLGFNGGMINKCYSSGNIDGNDRVGGLVGWNYNRIDNCYSTGSVSGNLRVGGLIGNAAPLAATATSFWDIETSDCNTSAGGVGKTTVEMKTIDTFTDAGWDFVEVWGISEHQTYPFLRFAPAGDLDYDKKVDLLDLALLASHWLEEK